MPKAKNLGIILSVRLPDNLVKQLHSYCEQNNITVSNAIRFALQALVNKPIGYKCEHVTVTFTSGFLENVTCTSTTCTMKPIYEGSSIHD